MKKKTFKSLITKEMFLNTFLYEEFINFWYDSKKDIQNYILKPIYLANNNNKPFFKFKKHFHINDYTKNKNCYGTINQPCKYCNNKDYKEAIEVCIFPVYIIHSPKKFEINKIKFVEFLFNDEMKNIDKYFDENFCLNINVSKNMYDKIQYHFRQEYYKLSETLLYNLKSIVFDYNYIYQFLFNKKRFIIENYDNIHINDIDNQVNFEKKSTIIEKDEQLSSNHIISFKNLKIEEKKDNDWIL